MEENRRRRLKTLQFKLKREYFGKNDFPGKTRGEGAKVKTLLVKNLVECRKGWDKQKKEIPRDELKVSSLRVNFK